MQSISRRSFVVQSTLTATGFLGLNSWTGLAIDPIKRSGPPRLLLSLAAYSFRDYFIDSNHKRDKKTEPGKRMDLFGFIDYCAAHGCAGTELTSYYFPAKLTDEFLIKIKRHAFLKGVEISGTAVGNTFTPPPGEARDKQIKDVKAWIDHAALLGAPHIRVFAGTAEAGGKAESKKRCIAALEECCDYAGKYGIFLGIENHGGIVAEADDLIDIIRAVKSQWVGVNLDTGNFHTADVYADIAKLAPYAVNVQLKGEIQPLGGKKQPSDLPRLMKILKDSGYSGYVALEYESAEDPYQQVPVLLGQMKALM